MSESPLYQNFLNSAGDHQQMSNNRRCPKCGAVMKQDQDFDGETGNAVSALYYRCDGCGHTDAHETP